MPQTPAEIIGEPSAFAERANISPGLARSWKCRNKFPRDAWPELMKAIPELTLDRLMALEKAGKAVRAKKARAAAREAQAA